MLHFEERKLGCPVRFWQRGQDEREEPMTDTAAAVPATSIDVSAVRRGGWLRFARALGWVLVWLGGLTLGFVVHQLWITTWLAELNQGELDAERIAYFEEAVITEVPYVPLDLGVPGSPTTPTTPPVPNPGGDPVDVEPVPQVLRVESAPPEHESFALIRIPRLKSIRDGWNVVEGVRRNDLKTGAGHMPWTPLPGQPGNAVISGHRTTYGAPFHDLDVLEPGDRIEVDTALGTHVYEVRENQIVKPTAVWVTEPREGAWLTLTTCNPKFSARQRLVVFAELISGPNAAVILANQ